MGQIEYEIKVAPFRIPKTVKKALEKGAKYKVEFTQRKQRAGVLLTPKIKINNATRRK